VNNIKQLIETMLDEVEQSAQHLEHTQEQNSKLARARLMTLTRMSQAWLSTFSDSIQEVEESHRNAKIMGQVFPSTSQAMRNQVVSTNPNNQGGGYLPPNGKAIHNFL
jgi:hypothetical protein